MRPPHIKNGALYIIFTLSIFLTTKSDVEK